MKLDWYKVTDRTPWQAFGASVGQALGRKAVAHAVASYSNSEGENAHPGVTLLMRDTGLSERTVRRHLTDLVTLGWIACTAKGHSGRGRNFADVYALRIPDLTTGHLADRWSDPTTGHDGPTTGHGDPTTGHLGDRPSGSLHQVLNIKADSDDDSSASASGRASLSERFDAFWQAYPRKVDKLDAERAFKAAVKRGVDVELLTRAAKSYAAQVRDKGAEFVKSPAKWLNAGSYENDPAPGSGAVLTEVPRYVPPAVPPELLEDPDASGAWLQRQRADWKRAHGLVSA